MSIDSRKPARYGYACRCERPLKQQIDLVAEFHAHRIHPQRIAYRTGIDLALIEALLQSGQGEFALDASQLRYFQQRLAHHRRARRENHLIQAARLRGTARLDMEASIDKDGAGPRRLQ